MPPGAVPAVLVPDVNVMSWPAATAVEAVAESEAPAVVEVNVIVRIAGL